MKYLADTNILIAFINNEQKIVEKFNLIDEIYVSCISIGELFLGANLSMKKDKNIFLINSLLACCKMYDINLQTAKFYAKIKADLRQIGKPIPDNDMWIVATALENNLVIASRDKHILNLNNISSEKW